MPKHDRAKREKDLRNELYARLYRQWRCKACGHLTCRPLPKKKCPLCKGDMKPKSKGT